LVNRFLRCSGGGGLPKGHQADVDGVIDEVILATLQVSEVPVVVRLVGHGDRGMFD
jgi:hypothetical protein